MKLTGKYGRDSLTNIQMFPPPNKFKIQIFEHNMWLSCIDTADNLEDALELAKSYLSWIDDGNNVRIACPDGKII